MFGFGKKKPLTPDDFAQVANDVERRIAEGDYVGAAQAAAALRRAAEKNNGERTAIAADAHFLEARTALALGDYPKALEHMRAASEVEGDDEETVKIRLTNIMNLGDILSELGQLDEAEAVHRKALEERRAFYGEDHPGFGYGAESLGTVLVRKGEYAEAAQLAKQAVAAFRDGEEHKLNATLILWMLAEKSQTPDRDVLDLLDDEDRARLIAAMPHAPAYLFIGATIDLRWEVYPSLEDEDEKFAMLTTLANHSEALERHEDRIRALKEYVALSIARSPDDGAFALQGLAIAYDEAGLHDEAKASYERALEIAKELRAQVLRNFAIYLGERSDPDRADVLFQEALQLADGDLYARAAGAYGIFLHHEERYHEAVPRLQACIEGLPAGHPDRLTADAHLQFARDGEGCNCGIGMPVALSGYVREVLCEYLPDPSLLDEVVVAQGFEISVTLSREPTPAEVEAIELATAEARRRIQEAEHR